jgi:hypothetical protein
MLCVDGVARQLVDHARIIRSEIGSKGPVSVNGREVKGREMCEAGNRSG